MPRDGCQLPTQPNAGTDGPRSGPSPQDEAGLNLSSSLEVARQEVTREAVVPDQLGTGGWAVALDVPDRMLVVIPLRRLLEFGELVAVVEPDRVGAERLHAPGLLAVHHVAFVVPANRSLI